MNIAILFHNKKISSNNLFHHIFCGKTNYTWTCTLIYQLYTHLRLKMYDVNVIDLPIPEAYNFILWIEIFWFHRTLTLAYCGALFVIRANSFQIKKMKLTSCRDKLSLKMWITIVLKRFNISIVYSKTTLSYTTMTVKQEKDLNLWKILLLFHSEIWISLPLKITNQTIL